MPSRPHCARSEGRQWRPAAPFDALDEAVAAANALSGDQGAYAFMRDLNTAHRLAEQIEAGRVRINHGCVSQPELPFGGIKASGAGLELGAEGIQVYACTKTVTLGRQGRGVTPMTNSTVAPKRDNAQFLWYPMVHTKAWVAAHSRRWRPMAPSARCWTSACRSWLTTWAARW
ncbi:MAG: aldehyde dehydrogenase family protein [Rubrivivax sp.]|nr:aldehyde dehydrogenase family protein [Rubrivivax sp.]MDP3610871.1 aldehyde dehydrogenase family protein [Rubrivivax sp.]